MIHIRASVSHNAMTDEPVLHLSFVGRPTLLKLQELLNRSLNCASEFGQEWFELSDKLAGLIHESRPLSER